MLTSTLLAATLVTAVVNPTMGNTANQYVPLTQYVNHLVQQTVGMTKQEINIDVQTMVLTATHNFSLQGDTPVLNARIQMQDIVQVNAPSAAQLDSLVKSEQLTAIKSDKATAE
ncbi:MAG: hypothetical protein P8J70_12935 [Glaciecola sp.]|jgi:hypothetical protein|nr:hypothetical protein [Glaciecola sp.]MDG2100566.1 hypothetical protein [Glaciecola sp.]